MEETGELRSAAPGEWAAEHLSNAGPVEDKQTPEHLELNTTELIKTKPKDLALITGKTLAQIRILSPWNVISCSKNPTSMAVPNSLFSLMG